jgi:hypothetical protein
MEGTFRARRAIIAEPAGWSEREAAVQLRYESDLSSGYLPSLTLNVERNDSHVTQGSILRGLVPTL